MAQCSGCGRWVARTVEWQGNKLRIHSLPKSYPAQLKSPLLPNQHGPSVFGSRVCGSEWETHENSTTSRSKFRFTPAVTRVHRRADLDPKLDSRGLHRATFCHPTFAPCLHRTSTHKRQFGTNLATNHPRSSQSAQNHLDTKLPRMDKRAKANSTCAASKIFAVASWEPHQPTTSSSRTVSFLCTPQLCYFNTSKLHISFSFTKTKR